MESPGTLRWTIIAEKTPHFQETCGHRLIRVHTATTAQLKKALTPWLGKIATIGLPKPYNPADQTLFLQLRAERLCPVGQCQSPSYTRHHDGRPQLADLVKWIDREN